MTITFYKDPDAIVTSEWLSAHIDDPSMRIFDCTTHLVPEPGSEKPYRVVSGRTEYLAGHIPGSGYLDLQEDFSMSDSPFGMTLADAGHVANAFARAGIGDGTRVILYSRNSMSWATRFWWMLRWLGFDNAAVLDGGFNNWVANGQPVSQTPTNYPPGSMKYMLRPTLFVGRLDVYDAIENPALCTICALGPDVFSGNNPRYGRPGRIPGSVNVPQVSLIDPVTYEFLPATTVAGIFSAAGVERGKGLITYCGSGIFATLNAFLLHQIGYDDIAVYDNSMSEWGKDVTLPIEVG